MLKPIIELIEAGRVHRVKILRNDACLSYADVIDGWENSAEFRELYVSLFADAPFDALFWESPAVTRSSVDQPYEFVLIESPHLSAAASDPSAFASAFGAAASGEQVAVFQNIGKDALLVAPTPYARPHVYAHLAAFARGAPKAQQHELFRMLAGAIKRTLSEQPLWVSTSGLGVYWLHVRLDSYPKYYNFEPYRRRI